MNWKETIETKIRPLAEAGLSEQAIHELVFFGAFPSGHDTAYRQVIASEIAKVKGFNLHQHLERQRNWSRATFGPGLRTKGVIDHIRKELGEIAADPTDLKEWIDVVLLALDGAWRTGASPTQIIEALEAKQAKNMQREWPDWRSADPDKAIEHVRKEGEA